MNGCMYGCMDGSITTLTGIFVTVRAGGGALEVAVVVLQVVVLEVTCSIFKPFGPLT